MTDTPSAILNAAADRIRDLAAAATPGPWRVVDTDFDGYDEAAGKPGPPDYAYLNNVSNARFGKSCGCCTEGTIPPGTARWIAALSPAVAPMIEGLLRRAAVDVDVAKRTFSSVRYAEMLDGRFAEPLALAEAILVSGVDTP